LPDPARQAGAQACETKIYQWQTYPLCREYQKRQNQWQMRNMKKIVYVDMDNVLADFPSAFPKLPKSTLDEYRDREDEIPGIFSLMKPVPGAVDAFMELAEQFDVYVLSTSPWGNPSAWSEKLLWVKK